MSNTLIQTVRNAELQAMVEQLEAQKDRRADFVAPATAITARNGRIHVESEGLVLAPTPVMIGTMADRDRLDLPTRHLREFIEGHTDPSVALAEMHAADSMINARLARAQAKGQSFMVRTFEPGPNDGGVGIGRALLSNAYQIVDNFDALMAVLEGIKESGVHVEVQGGDLTETRMRVRFYSPAVHYMAEQFLQGYRNPFGHGPGAHSGYEQGQEPIVWAGFELSNSETGGGAFTLCPRFVVQMCRNGAKLTKHAIREVHLVRGGRLESGAIRYQADTQATALELVRKKTRDAVAMFLDADWLEDRIRELEADAGVEVPPTKAQDVVERVAKEERWSDEETKSILGHFVAGGQLTAGGVMQAVTATAQTVTDPERAAELEDSAVGVLNRAARVAVTA